MNIKISALILALSMSATSVMAAGTAIESGQPITGGDTGDCVLLGDNVSLNLSKDVYGAYSCTEVSSAIKVATCHKSGSRKPTNVSCAVTGEDASGNPTYNDSSCDGTSGQTFEITDYRAFVANSRGGSVSATDLGGACSDTQVGGLSHFND
ncbi:hypothetical protein OUY36_05045 [Stutzerimonas sp. R40042]|uniref:hypothetical protein n=1 Tax=Stutzerimonas sp. R40042 TaxID=2998559 RepID=UPI0022778069|nr:hypothetical protein [Stutzerimonas sp. R40042]WAE62949.1 hypothetical protein OUY36_05045 [Stutzerimonas sp. R40042]